MTNLEALKAAVNFPLPIKSLEKPLIDSDLDPDSQYSKTNAKGIDLCAIELLFVILTTGDEKESEWSLVGPSEKKVLARYSYLTAKWGEPNLLEKPADPEPTIEGFSIW